MRKMLATALVAMASLCFHTAEASDPRWGYAYITDWQCLASNEPVTWNGDQGTFSEGVYFNCEDPSTIVIKHPGIYLVTYSTTVEVLETAYDSDQGDAQFALFLNETLVPGSVYGVGNAFGCEFITSVFYPEVSGGPYDAQTQCNGQAIIRVRDHYSQISLRNYCENLLGLSATAGTDDSECWGHNVSASIAIQRIDKIDED